MTAEIVIYQLGIPHVGRDRRLRLSSQRPRIRDLATSIIASVGPAPLVDSIQEKQRRGRPSRRPVGIPPRLWEQWLRNVAARGFEDTPEALARWIAKRKEREANALLRHGWGVRRDAFHAPEVVWVTVIHRKDITPSVEREWRIRIAHRRPGDPLYRIHLRGVQRREVR